MVNPFLALLTKIVNSRTSHDIDMKLGPVPKLDKRNMATPKKKKKKDDAVLAIVMSMSFFRFMLYLQPSPEAGLNFH